MPFKVSGAPLTATTHLRPLGSLTDEMVDIRFRAEENWYRRLMVICDLCGASLELGERLSPLDSFQSRAESVVFSIGSPTMVPSSSSTRAWAAASAKVVSFLVFVTATSSFGLLELKSSALGIPDIQVTSDSLYSSDTLDDQIFARDRARLVETTNVDAAGKGDTERLGAEDGCAGQL